jgi:uncharacterized protein (DUF2236 family)
MATASPQGWRWVHDRCTVGLFYAQRAFCIGVSNPLVFVATAIRSTITQMPFERFARTAKTFETIFFGGRLEADRVLADVEAKHKAATGVLPMDIGLYPAGTPYSALSPELMPTPFAGQRELSVGPVNFDARRG